MAATVVQNFGIPDGAADLLVEISHVTNICWKFQWDISNGFRVIHDLMKIPGESVNQPTLQIF